MIWGPVIAHQTLPYEMPIKRLFRRVLRSFCSFKISLTYPLSAAIDSIQ